MQVTVQYVNQPREAHWKSGNIKCSDGRYYAVPVEHLVVFQPNQTYDIDIAPVYKQDGSPGMSKVTAVNGQPLGVQQQVGQALPGQYQQPPVPPHSPQQYQRAPAPSPAPAGSPAIPDKRSEDIFLCGVLQNCLHGQGMPSEAELHTYAAILRRVYRGDRSVIDQRPPSENPADFGDPFDPNAM